MPADVARRFREKFRRPIHSFYGSSECGGICYDREGDTVEEGFVGTAMNGVTIDILEPGGRSEPGASAEARLSEMAISLSLTKRNWATVFSFPMICCEKPSAAFALSAAFPM